MPKQKWRVPLGLDVTQLFVRPKQTQSLLSLVRCAHLHVQIFIFDFEGCSDIVNITALRCQKSGFSRQVFPGRKLSFIFSAAVKRRNYSYIRRMRAHHPLQSASLYRVTEFVKLGMQQVSFEPDVWKQCSVKKWERTEDKQISRHCRTITSTRTCSNVQSSIFICPFLNYHDKYHSPEMLQRYHCTVRF